MPGSWSIPKCRGIVPAAVGTTGAMGGESSPRKGWRGEFVGHRNHRRELVVIPGGGWLGGTFARAWAEASPAESTIFGDVLKDFPEVVFRLGRQHVFDHSVVPLKMCLAPQAGARGRRLARALFVYTREKSKVSLLFSRH